MKNAALAALIVLGGALLLARIVGTCLAEYGRASALAIGIGATGAIGSLALFLVLRRRPRAARAVRSILLALLLALPVSWLVWPARIVHAQFGLTVYGILPVPGLDLTIRANGLPGFRDKSHRIRRAEIEPLLDDRTTDVVIGTGWQEVARVDPDVFALPGVSVHSMSTPSAIRFYHELRDAGRRVVLILHTTC